MDIEETNLNPISDTTPTFAEPNSIGDVTAPEPDADVEAFMQDDPGDIPEIADLKNQLRAGFHRQMNKLNAKQQSVGGGSDLERKAKAFDTLLANPQALDSLKSMLQNPAQQQPHAAIPFANQQVISKLPKAISDKFEAEHLGPLVDLTWQVIEQGLLPALRPYQVMLEQQAMRSYQADREKTVQDFPEQQTRMAEAEQLAAQKGLTLRQAMLILADGKAAPRTQVNGSQGRILPRSVPGNQTQRVSTQNGLTDDDLAKELFSMDQGASNRYSLNFMRRE